MFEDLIRTDLAMEAHELLQTRGEKLGEQQGIISEDYEFSGFPINKVKIINDDGAKKIGKPKGTYITIDLKKLLRREDDAFLRASRALAQELRGLLPQERKAPVLVAGLGNRNITPDAVGPKTIDYVMVTRHLKEHMPEQFGAFSSTAAISPGVLGLTGVETGEILKGVAEKIGPSAIIAIDALASRRVSRLCTTVQLCDSGIVPGGGVGNARSAINREIFGVPVIAVGVPKVVDAATLVSDIAGTTAPKNLDRSQNLVVTPKDIDKYISDTAKVLGYGINFALHDNLSVADMEMFLS